MNVTGLKQNIATRSPDSVLFRCGGTPVRTRWSLKAAGCPERIAVPLVALVDLYAAVTAQGWSLALGVPDGAPEPTLNAEDKLDIPASAVYDPMCPNCTTALLDRLRTAGSW